MTQIIKVNSRKLLRNVMQIINKDNTKILNVDSTIIAEEPKLASYTEIMRENISSDIGIEKFYKYQVQETHEKIGSLGKGVGIAALVNLLIRNQLIIFESDFIQSALLTPSGGLISSGSK